MIRVDEAYSNVAMEEASKRLREARIAAGYSSAAEAARALGIKESSYRAHENGQNEFDLATARRYARFFRVAPEWLLTGSGTKDVNQTLTALSSGQSRVVPVHVIGFVKAGVWQDITESGVPVIMETVPASDEYPPEWQYAVIVDGESVNKTARNGERLICLDLNKSSAGFDNNDLVIVERIRFGGQLVERTAKRARMTIRGWELWPDSDDPDHQDPIPYETENGEDDQVRVVAKVLYILRRP